jgi:hypothetical protein
MFGANPKWSKNLCIWGEAGVMTVGNDSKMGDRGTTMFMGYSEHESDSIKMWDPSTNRVIMTYNVIWL